MAPGHQHSQRTRADATRGSHGVKHRVARRVGSAPAVRRSEGRHRVGGCHDRLHPDLPRRACGRQLGLAAAIVALMPDDEERAGIEDRRVGP
jgi:hypothetical protein